MIQQHYKLIRLEANTHSSGNQVNAVSSHLLPTLYHHVEGILNICRPQHHGTHYHSTKKQAKSRVFVVDHIQSFKSSREYGKISSSIEWHLNTLPEPRGGFGYERLFCQ